MDKRFQWTEFYMELASALLHYKNNRSELIAKLKTIFADAGMNFPFKERGKEVYEEPTKVRDWSATLRSAIK